MSLVVKVFGIGLYNMKIILVTFSFLQEIDFFFGGRTFSGKNTATFSDCTLCIVKPHAIVEGTMYSLVCSIL